MVIIFFSNKLQEEQVNGELECLVLASDGLWDVVENEVITLPQFSHSSKQAVDFYVNLYNCMKAIKHHLTVFTVCFGVTFLLLTKWAALLILVSSLN